MHLWFAYICVYHTNDIFIIFGTFRDTESTKNGDRDALWCHVGFEQG